MCDTQFVRHPSGAFFAKNSNREPSEAQLVCYYPPVNNDSARQLRTTYMAIPQVPDRYGIIVSRPAWMWGAEMGVNEKGVVIGNEAIFSRLVKKSGAALLGMDLVRLGLERAASAGEALACITGLLACHGQGGPAGYRDKSFRYDSSFIIADPVQAWVLETAGRHWVAKKIESYAAISNALTLAQDFELCSDGLVDFALKNRYFSGRGDFSFAAAFDTRVMKTLCSAEARRRASERSLAQMLLGEAPTFLAMAASLRQHHRQGAFSNHNNRDICMHAGGITRPSQTCNSMIVHLRLNEAPRIMLTGTSAPCLSLFQPLVFDDEATASQSLINSERSGIKESLWYRFEPVHRLALRDQGLRAELIHHRDEVEANIYAVVEAKESMAEAWALGEQWHGYWSARVRSLAPRYRWYSAYDRYWKRLNRMDGLDVS